MVISIEAGSRPASAASARAICTREATFPSAGKKPSPTRPARRAEAGLWPPMWTGTRPAGGLGLELTRSNDTNSPSKDTSSSAHTRLITSRYSSVRAPRRAQGTPRASNSSRSQPTPIPSSTRPPDMESTVATSLAKTRGWRSASSEMPVASRISEVAAATCPSQASGSGMGLRPDPGIFPLGP